MKYYRDGILRLHITPRTEAQACERPAAACGGELVRFVKCFIQCVFSHRNEGIECNPRIFALRIRRA